MTDPYLTFAKSIPFPPGRHIGADQERIIAEAVRNLVEPDLFDGGRARKSEGKRRGEGGTL